MMKKILILLFVIIAMACNVLAQSNLFKDEYFYREIQVGDTIILCYNEIRNIHPNKTYESKYIDGFFYVTPKYDIKDKRKKHPIVVYGGSQGNDYTPFLTIAEKKMIVLSINNEKINSDKCLSVYLYNVEDGDTIKMLESIWSRLGISLGVKPYDYIKLPQYQRIVSSKIMKPNLYVTTSDTTKYQIRILSLDRHKADNRNIYDTWTEYMYFSDYHITDVGIMYNSFEATPIITLSYKVGEGAIKQMEAHYNENTESISIYSIKNGEKKWDGRSAFYVYSADDIASIEKRESNKIASISEVVLQEKKDAGNYHFELTKVDKPKSSNVRKGVVTKNAIYEDNIISIKWDAYEYYMRFDFMLKNMTNSTMKVLWDEAIIVNFDGFTERILHKGADIEALQKSQQPAIIPALAQLSDFFCSEKYFGGKRLMGGYGGDNNGGVNDGKKMKLILPVQVGSTTYTYTFTFTLRWKYKYPELQQE